MKINTGLYLQKYAKDSQEKTDILLALDVPINPNITNEKLGGRWGGPTETRFNKVRVVGWTTVTAECSRFVLEKNGQLIVTAV